MVSLIPFCILNHAKSFIAKKICNVYQSHAPMIFILLKSPFSYYNELKIVVNMLFMPHNFEMICLLFSVKTLKNFKFFKEHFAVYSFISRNDKIQNFFLFDMDSDSHICH